MSQTAGAPSRRGGVGWTHRATAQDVALVANVSAQTVSRVANGAPNVRPETRERVLAAMAKVGYAPNAAARALRSGKSNLIGVIVHHMGRTGETHIVRAVAAAAHHAGHPVALMDATSGRATDLNDAIGRLRTDLAGLIVLGLETSDVESVRVPVRMPVVIADSRALIHPTVGFDQRGGASLAVTHLLGLGHPTVHHLGGPLDSVQAHMREDAWRETLTVAGKAVPEPWHGDWSPASGYAIGRQIAEDPAVSAVFAANDEMAAGLMRALHEAGRLIPDDVSVVGFDDVLADYLWPPLTSVHQDFSGLGDNLVRLLLQQIDPDAPRERAVIRLVPSRLVVRSSSARYVPR